MVDIKIERPQLSLAQLKPALPAVIVGSLLFAAWFGWSGWEQYRDGARRIAVQQARDTAVQQAQSAIAADTTRLVEQVGKPAFLTALTAGDFATASAELAKGWPEATGASVQPIDLDAAYAGLAGGGKVGYGRLAAQESALLADKPVVAIVKEGGGNQLALAAPVPLGGVAIGVASVLLPANRVAGAVEQAAIDEGSYLALRQGGHSVVERGDAELNTGAEAMAAKIPGSDLRVAAAVPDVAGGPFGLGAIACLGAAAGFLLLALAAWRAPTLRRRKGGDEDVEPEAELTLADVAVPAPAAASPAPTESRPATAPGGLVVDPGIFRAYDIRGVVGTTLDVGVATQVGQAIGTVMHEKGLVEIVVGRDGRLSGPDLAGGLIDGLRKAGCNVIDIGMAPTPLVYFGAYFLRAGSCVSVTGSHNPPDYNGFKIVIGGETLAGDTITDLYQRIVGERLHMASTPGQLQHREISEDYVERIAADVQLERPLRVVVDAGNGVAGDLGPRVLRAIGAEVTPLYCEIDGTFPNHHPDPSEPHNLEDLIGIVQRLDADLGIAFDGDGDRLGVVTRDGENIFPDRLLMLFAADVLERNPGAQIIYDVKCTGRLPGHILRHGGSPLMWKTGHSLIKAKMRETEAELAGEMSGHFFFKERWYGFDDGIYAAARLLEILAGKPGTPTATLAALPTGIATPEIKVDAPDGNPHVFVEHFVAQARFEGARLSTIDGLRVDWPDGWGLVRASNTTPILVMRFDADNDAAMARIKANFREQLLAIKPDLALPF
ncbi:phosphomannomutase/phosphoglucomutase [Aerolutibacter ruishenii]|uniref:phosphomannomutase n=1 Tax=Aerolutibacter ruishenii TaxID=686800 RepID=A0A562M114_9GAMM|nr:phosphomannomutase/phosphoglucomutase [Lysobacter ruishenii]TWI13635.1 phosphomannomutase/phosphoglucomutase [Lysobacter ruishenii]